VRGRLGGQVWLDPPVLDACYAPLLPDVQMRIGIIRHGRVHAIVIADYSFGPRTRGGHRLRDDLATADIGRPRRRSPTVLVPGMPEISAELLTFRQIWALLWLGGTLLAVVVGGKWLVLRS